MVMTSDHGSGRLMMFYENLTMVIVMVMVVMVNYGNVYNTIPLMIDCNDLDA